MFCENCGQKLDGKDKFCEHCGFEVEKTFIENKKSKPRRWIWKIVFILILLAIIGVGAWQFNHYFVIQKRSKVQAQIDTLNKKIDELNKKNNNSSSNSNYWMDRYFDLKANPKTEYVPYQAPSTPSFSTCNWIGNYYHCTYF